MEISGALVDSLLSRSLTEGTRITHDRGRESCTCQIILAENNQAPIGSDAVERSITELHLAAVVFATQLAVAESYDPTSLWQIRAKFVAALAGYAGTAAALATSEAGSDVQGSH
jgi:hypothetical protein